MKFSEINNIQTKTRDGVLPLMGNQWIPLGVKCSLDEKIKLSAILDDACNGGCASMSYQTNY